MLLTPLRLKKCVTNPFIIRYVPTCFITLGIWHCSLACTLAFIPNSLNLKNV